MSTALLRQPDVCALRGRKGSAHYSDTELKRRARHHFVELSRQQVAAAIRRMATEGFGDYEIAAACGLAVEQVRAILGERPEASTGASSRRGNRGRG